jgi:TonB-linked SusC/RagA family outer membrane protein
MAFICDWRRFAKNLKQLKYMNAMRNQLLLLLASFAFGVSAAMAQSVSGKVTDSANGEGLPGVAVVVVGSNTGVMSDMDGVYRIQAATGDVLSFSFIGFNTVRKEVSGASMDVSMESGVALDEVVVTALGVSREKKALGYSVQELGNSAFTDAKTENVVRSLTGKIAGVQVTSGTAIGSSSKVLLRGASSITGDNQPLFVVDGVPMDNADYSSGNTQRATGGYDYGNAIQDLNPDDIESVSVLKGPAAAALYGSRASNGAIVVTTKSGKGYQSSGKRGIGISVNSGVAFNNVYVLPDYQNSYGGGAGTAWIDTIDGNFIPDYGYDGSWGPKLDGTMVRHWDSWYDYEGDADFGQTRAWSPTESDVADYFQTGVTLTNNVSVTGATDESAFRLSYTNHDQTGVYENSSLDRNTLSFSGSQQVSEDLEASVSMNYVQSQGNGRPQTGYGNSIMSQFTQWGQRQLSMDRLRNYKNPDGSHRTWNRNSVTDASPHYWDNPFWERYENVQNDQRDRVFGNITMKYKINDVFSLMGRALSDFYIDRREERVAVGGVNESSYSESTRQLQETNLDAYLNFTDDLSDDLNLTGFVGVNQRIRNFKRLNAYTLGGLNTPGLYTVNNGADGYEVGDFSSSKVVNSVLGSASFGYKRKFYADFTGRNDWSSTLPEANSSYFYPSATASYVLSEDLDMDAVSFAKVRLGWAQVGNDTDPYRTATTYAVNTNFGNGGSATVPNSQNNPNLRPEKTSSWEAGLELNLFLDKVRFDFTYYSSTTEDLIFNVPVSASSGYSSAVLNAGKTSNKGIEMSLAATLAQTDDLRWDIGMNFAKNRNELLELADGIENIRYTSLFGVTLEARPGQPLGTFYGYDFQYDDDGNKLVDDDGFYLSSDEVQPLGTILPNFTGGVYTTLDYKNLSFYALVDFQDGGSLHSYSNQWGKYSGTLAETAMDADGNDIRDPGFAGVVVEGVNATTGAENTVAIDPQSHFFYNQGYIIHAADQYDASFVKLREMRLDYSLPADMVEGSPFSNVSIGVFGRNLAILHKNVPHIDPEVATSASNIQGFEGGQLPAERTIGVNVKFGL